MPERATLSINITRSGDTLAQAENRLRKANVRFVEELVPTIRTATLLPPSADPDAPKWVAHPLDFYVRDVNTGAILKNGSGNDRVRDAALANAVQVLLAQYHRDTVTAAIRREKTAETEAAIANEVSSDTD